MVQGTAVFALKKLIKSAGGAGFRFFLEKLPAFQDLSLVLMYHRVVDQFPPDPYDRDICVSGKTFEMQIRLLKKLFTLVPIDSMVRPRLAGRYCAITFDDGWLDNYQVAYPILKKYRVPATVFLPAGMIGTNSWFWFESIWDLASKSLLSGKGNQFVDYFADIVPQWNEKHISRPAVLQLISSLKLKNGEELERLIQNAYQVFALFPPQERILLDWNEVKEMGADGITFGAHGLNHRIIPTLEYPEKEKEINNSLHLLRDHDIPVSSIFCFPNGNWDDDCLQILSTSGYTGAVTTRKGRIMQNENPFLLGRIGIHEDIGNTPFLFSYRLYQAL